MYAPGFRFYFTPLSGVLFAFPSRYLFTIGRQRVFSLRGCSAPYVQAGLHEYSRPTLCTPCACSFMYGAITSYGQTFQFVPLELTQLFSLGCSTFARHYLTESRLISIPPVTEMFPFTGFAPLTLEFSRRYLLRGGFPHSEIFGSKHICRLPEAYRRLPRPSSPSVAKASTMCTLIHLTAEPQAIWSHKKIQSARWFSNATSHS